MSKPNEWTIRFGATRKAKDKALLAALEKEIADEEKLRARGRLKSAIELPTDRTAKAGPAPCVSDEEHIRIARAFGRMA